MSLAHSNESSLPPSPADTGHGHGPHIVSPKILLGVYLALVVFTGITVSVALVDLGKLNIIVCLAIAVIKGALVVLFFMHLRWDSPFNAVILITALIFVALFIGLALLDVNSYAPNYTPPQAAHIAE